MSCRSDAEIFTAKGNHSLECGSGDKSVLPDQWNIKKALSLQILQLNNNSENRKANLECLPLTQRQEELALKG